MRFQPIGADKSQNDLILEWLEAGNEIDQLTALAKFKCFRLAARIKDLRRRGKEIVTSDKVLTNGKSIAVYRMNRRGVVAAH